MHGLGVTAKYTYPYLYNNSGTTGFYDRMGDFVNAVVADGWLHLYPNFQDDFYVKGSGALGLFTDVQNDTAHGTRYLNTTLHWFDHVVAYLAKTYGSGHPLIIMGASWGAWHALQLAANRRSSLIGYIAHQPPTILEGVSPTFVSSPVFSSISWTGIDLPVNYLSSMAVTIPGIIGYGTADEAIGYNGSTTVDTGSNNADVSTFVGAQTLNVVDSSTCVPGPLIKLQTSNGFAYVKFTAKGAGVLNNCTTITGSGTVQTGYTIIQSTASAMVAAGIAASLPVTSNATGETHEFTGTPSGTPNDANTYATWVASNMDPLAPANAF
jgi:hypothetical protein